jgi:hypothetical protein
LTYEDIAELLKRAMEDPGFREKLVSDPEEALKDHERGPGPAAVRFFGSLDDTVFTRAADRYREAREARETLGQADMEA